MTGPKQAPDWNLKWQHIISVGGETNYARNNNKDAVWLIRKIQSGIKTNKGLLSAHGEVLRRKRLHRRRRRVGAERIHNMQPGGTAASSASLVLERLWSQGIRIPRLQHADFSKAKPDKSLRAKAWRPSWGDMAETTEMGITILK
jgi:hypothetical protein